MKLNAISLFLGLCVAILAVAASPAFARSTTGFSAFDVEAPTGSDPYTCLNENNGAVVNSYAYDVSLELDLPIDTPGEKTIYVQNGWFGTDPEETFTCYSYDYAGTGGSSIVGTPIHFNGPGLKLPTQVNANGLTSIQVICWNVPPNGGLANFNWNP